MTMKLVRHLRGNAIGEPTRSQLRALFPGAALKF